MLRGKVGGWGIKRGGEKSVCVWGGGHAYSVIISWGRLGENGKGRGYYKQLYHLNIALGSITIPKKKKKRQAQ